MRFGDLSPAELVDRALGGAAGTLHDGSRRERFEPPPVRGDVAWLRDVANTLRATSPGESEATADCLDDQVIADLLQGACADADFVPLIHLAGCGRCFRRIHGVAGLLAEDDIVAELRRLDGPAHATRRRRGVSVAAAAGPLLAAAVVAGLLLSPLSHREVDSVTPGGGGRDREPAITTTAAPRVIGPTGLSSPSDSMLWTSVPHADLYHVRLFNREGTLVWDAETRDTALSIPAHLLRPAPTSYLWKVDARTGWDRWVGSQWAELTIKD